MSQLGIPHSSYCMVVWLGDRKVTVEIISYQTETYTAIFNEILTCNNNALLSDLMAFILYKNKRLQVAYTRACKSTVSGVW